MGEPLPTRIRVTVERDRDSVVAVTIQGPFGQATLNRRELDQLLAALQEDLICEGREIYLSHGTSRKTTKPPV